jgi:hypothetical protein
LFISQVIKFIILTSNHDDYGSFNSTPRKPHES